MTNILKSKSEREMFKKIIKYAVENPYTLEQILSKNLKDFDYEDKTFFYNLLKVLVNAEFAKLGYETLKSQSKMRTEADKPLIYVKINEFLEQYSLNDAAKINADLEKLARFILLYNQTINSQIPTKDITKRILEEKGVHVDFIEQQRRKGVHKNIIKIFKFVINEAQEYELQIFMY